MNTATAYEIARGALEHPISTWLDYSPKNTPLVLFDDKDFIFMNHPDPPAKRPDILNDRVGTAAEINGVLTATIPAEMCGDEKTLVPLLYHECFHVYQNRRFKFEGNYDFFEVLSFYPELDAAYRALCSAETEILSDQGLPAADKARRLSAVVKRRRQILALHDGLLDFEDRLERLEGTASYVDQKVSLRLFGKSPDNSSCCYGFSRQYFVGADLCWLFERMFPAGEWQGKIEGGLSLSELLLEMALPEYDVSSLGLEAKERRENQEVAEVLSGVREKIECLRKNGALTIQLPSKIDVFRSFNPGAIVSFGDGRLVHLEFVTIQIPNGSISIKGGIALEDYTNKTVTLPSTACDIKNNRLDICTENVKVSLENVARRTDGTIEVLQDHEAI